jgi:tRNA(Arg) A34 adenosine deaminase TadA
MIEAINLAVENIENGGGPFGAVIVKDGKIIGKGANRVTLNNDPTAHAEIQAIRDACKNLETFNLDGCEIYTSCEPCPMCLGAIYWSGLNKIYYGADQNDAADADFSDAEIYKELATPPRVRKVKSVEMLKEEAKKAFEKWKSFDNKVKY